MYNNLQVTDVLLENEYQKIVKCIDEITGEIYLYNAITNNNIIKLMDIMTLNELKSNIIKCFKKDDNMYILMRPHDVNKQLMIKKHVDSKKMTLKKQYNIASQLIDLFISVYNYSDLFQLKVINFDNISVDEYDTLYINGYLEFTNEYDLSDNYTYRSVGQILHYVFSGKEAQNGDLSDRIPPDVRKIISKCLSHEYFHPKDIKREFENSSIYGIISGKTDSIKANYEPFVTENRVDNSNLGRKELRRENKEKKKEVIEIETIVTNTSRNKNVDMEMHNSISIADKIEGNYKDNDESVNFENQPTEVTADIEQKNEQVEEKTNAKGKGWKREKTDKKEKKEKFKKRESIGNVENTENDDIAVTQDNSDQNQENNFTEKSEEQNENIDRSKVIVSQVNDIDEVDFYDDYGDEYKISKDFDKESNSEFGSYVGDPAGYYDDEFFIDNNKVLTEEDMKKMRDKGGEFEEDGEVINIYINNGDDDSEENDSEYEEENYEEEYDEEYEEEYDEDYDEDDYDDEDYDEEEGGKLSLILKIMIPIVIVAVIVGIILFFVKAINRTEESVNSFYVSKEDSDNKNMSNNSEDGNTEVDNNKNSNNENPGNDSSNNAVDNDKNQEILSYINSNTIEKTGYTGEIVVIDDSIYSSGSSSMLAENKNNDSQKFLFASIDFNSDKFLKYKKGNVGISASFKSLKDIDNVKIVVEIYKNNSLSESSGFLVDVYNDIWTSKQINIDATKVDIVNLYVEITGKNNVWIDNLSINSYK